MTTPATPETFTVRDHRVPGWFWAQNEVITVYGPQLGAHGIAVYMAMALRADNVTGECRLSCRKIARQVGVSAGGALNALRLIASLGLARLLTPGTNAAPAVYVLLDIKASGVHGVNTGVQRVNAVFTGKTPHKEDKTFIKTKPNPPRPLSGGANSPRALRKINREIERRAPAWAGLAAVAKDRRIDGICCAHGVSPDSFRDVYEWPRAPIPELELEQASQEEPCTAKA